jgi:sterol desaturase/sphingolipid hydroxylase (fatty acid hydroxylase superfamily)
MIAVNELIRYIATAGLVTLIMMALAISVEMVAPKTTYPLTARVRGVLFFVVFMMTIGGTIHYFSLKMWALVGAKPLVVLYLDKAFGWAGWAAPALEIAAAVLVLDLFGYWYHRIQHAFLWRFHALHHCVEDLHATAVYGHFAEDVFRVALLIIPLGLVSMHRGPEPAIVGFLIGWKEYLIHTSSTANFGPFRYLLTDNVYHRIHHSKDPAHFNKNFGIITPIWDVVFGTAYFPKAEEWPDTGLDGVPEPKTFADFLLFPLRGFRPAAAPLAAE